jgi:tRNA dimethylallyltransferase
MAKTGKNKTVVVIAGPTGVGKTAVAIEIARHFNAEIISADSRQCYREMNIGVARPSPAELLAVRHHFIATHSILDEVTAAMFEDYALELCAELFRQKNVIVMAGGTGLYLKAFCDGLDDIPDVPSQIREIIVQKYNAGGMNWLIEEIKEKDPLFYTEGETQNPQRMMRALEVMEATGQSILQFHKGKKVKRSFNTVKIGLELPKSDLHQRINHRVDKMIASGLVNEVKGLMQHKRLNALQTVGYQEILDHLENKLTLEEAIDKIKIHTRQYAKRQMTWFKRDNEMIWLAPGNTSLIISKIKECAGNLS